MVQAELLLKNNAISTCTPSVTKLGLTCFRSYRHLSLDLLPKPVVVIGENGAGKTNVLEALSMLAPGKGFRNAPLSEMDHQLQDVMTSTYPWIISATIQTSVGVVQIGTGREPSATHINKRVIRIDGQPVKSQSRLPQLLSVLWLTPLMDHLFVGSSAERRKFLDRLVLTFDPEHAARVGDYETSMRERARLLKKSMPDNAWLSALEEQMVSTGLAIAAARLHAIAVITEALTLGPGCFPKPRLFVKGRIESLLQTMPALDAEESFRSLLKEHRQLDRVSGRTLVGTHRSDLDVWYEDKTMPARLCSTGEQKALLLSITMAEARARHRWHLSPPIMLLDEVVAHLDPERRAALFAELETLGSQVWMTGTDRSLFEPIFNRAQLFTVSREDGWKQHR